MAASRLGGRDRRALWLGGAVIAASLVGARGVPALIRAERDAIEAARATQAEAVRARSSVGSAEVVRDSLRARNARYLALAPLLLDGDTPAGAAAALSAVVSLAAGASGVRMGSVQLRLDSAGGKAFTRVAVRTDVTGDIEGITGMLAALERGPELLLIRELAITQSDPAAGDDRPEALRMELVVEGLTLRRGTR